MKKFLLLLFTALLPLVASAQTTVEIDGIWYNLISKGKVAEVTSSGGTKYSGSITIPATVTYDGVTYSVTSIGGEAFWGCSSLTAITIPEGVTSIRDYAFKGCSSLTAINIPEGVKSIGDHAFRNCSSLTAVYISSIEAWCKITFENSESNPLYHAHNLYLNGELVTNLVIPEGVTSIGECAFYDCTSLTAITIPEGVTSIGDYAFYGCTSLTAITLPEGLTSIGNGAFDGCTSLTAITFPEGVKSIGNYAFKGCTSLTTIMLPKSVKSIGQEAFANCSELTDVYCNAETVPSTKADAFNDSYIEYATLHVPDNAVASYKTTAPWSSFGTIVSLDAAITRITLSQSSVTLTEGETTSLTITTTPENADRNLISWSSSNPSVATVDNAGKVTAIAPGTATITVTANDGSGVSAQCKVTVNELILGKCATPTISYKDGKVVLTCETEGAKVITTVAKGDDEIFEVFDFELIPTYTITAYATKEHYENSDPVSLTICWVPCTEEHEEDDADGILTIPAKPVLIQCQGGVITVSGLADGTEVAVYTTNGTLVATATAEGDTTHLTVPTGQVYIVKVADTVVKIGL